ncbi:MAG: ABC transporter permease [Fimbriiglobus sp.]|jgi:putative ABC transport system permease protein|nr:ABC transporter permease [Fimbriiglobus sp.]
MFWVALRMLTGDRAKYLGIVFGVSFAALLMGQQMAIFCGLMRNTTSQIRDVEGADVWVMDRSVQFVDDVKPMSDNKLLRVRGVEGVAWAVKLYKGLGKAKLADGNYQQVILLGLDYDNKDGAGRVVGQPREDRIVVGRWEDLDQPDAVFLDEFGWRYMFGQEIPFEPGRSLEINNKRANIVGLVKCNPTFQTFPILYTKFASAIQYAPPEPKTLPFILVKSQDGITPEEVCERIEESTGLRAKTNNQFFWMTIDYYLKRTGIPINFGITVTLGFVVGCAIAGQTFYLFTLENLKQFGSLKAMGVSNLRIVGMVMLQALVVGVIGYGLGIGGAAGFGVVFEKFVKTAPSAFYFGWQIPAITAGAVFLIITVSALMSLKKLLFLEAGVVFR